MMFSAHNVLLNNGQKKLGNKERLLKESDVWQSILQIVDLFLFGTSEVRSKHRVADLDYQECDAADFAQKGYLTLSVEARKANIDKCNLVNAGLQLDNLEFAEVDVHNLDSYGTFDDTFF